MADKKEGVTMDVGYVARLAHIELTADETEVFGKQLNEVLTYVDQLSELDLEAIETSPRTAAGDNFFREDKIVAGLERDVALNNAPSRTLTEFSVPKIME